ncbi:MAG: glycosyltransferase [Candidatus Heimdallarchaeota archaeon]|nr:glycosyltransferase [Candidatus Heimdallarchaeota archaeon]
MHLLLTIAAIIYLFLVIIACGYYLKISLGIAKGQFEGILGKIADEPFVSIIVPTFNEEANIVNCLESLCSLDYPHYEIILSDGGSTDKTVKLAQPLVDYTLVDSNLPEGWIGKNWGCHVASKIAKGELLLFTDADTTHKPDSLKKTVSMLKQKNAGLLTMLPYQELEKWWESIVPIYFFLSHLVAGGLKSINDPKQKDSFLGIGQYLLFTRKAYDTIGGHERIKGSIIEDFAFARITKVQLSSLYVMESNRLVSTQMYPDSIKQCWTGWKKCLYAGTKLTPGRKITITIVFVLWGIFAPVAVVLSTLYGSWLAIVIATGSYILFPFILWTYWREKGRHYWITYVFFPLLLLVFIIAMITSTFELLFTKTTTWRGRKYSPDLSAGLQDQYDPVQRSSKIIDHYDSEESVELHLTQPQNMSKTEK